MSRVLAAWATPADGETINASPTRKILRNRMRALDSIVEKGFLQIGDIVSSLNVLQKKSLCLWLRDLPPDPGRKYSVRKILSLMKISRASYYAILKNGTYGQSVVQRNAQDEQDAELIRTVMEYKGFAKGSRQIYMMMPALTGKRMGLKKIRRIMKTYNLTSSIRKAAPSKRMGGAALKKNVRPNLLQRRFRLYRPNEVRLTDVTHLLYGDGCKAYAYTKEILGHCVSSRMTVSLVKSAYDVMMENHGHELRGAACVIHSDQGSQYLSTTFQRLLSDDGFLQSVSDRGNSQDNAPMESFFGRLKCELLDLVALCPDASTVSRMISGYIDAYNHRHYQYALAGLTPSEYYTYVTTGIYPVDNYYGIKATELMPIQALIAARRRAAEEKAKKYREASAKKRAMAQGKKKDPEFVIARDQRILRREIAKWTRSKELALQQISHLREILELSQKARAYLMTASADLILQLYNGENWGAHPELAYIYKMRELF